MKLNMIMIKYHHEHVFEVIIIINNAYNKYWNKKVLKRQNKIA